VVFDLQGARIEVPGRVLIERADMHLERGEHVTLVGGNGSGKTTLIQTLTGHSELARGKLSTGYNVQVGYVSQHAEGLSEDGTLLEATQRATGLTPGKARALLGMFLFSGDDAMKPVDGLSGGERQRFSLAVLVNSGANLLVLDEPTNHLDVESREALEDALRGYPGSLLLVSHDRALLDAVGTRTIAIEDGELNSYEGGWADYVARRDEARAQSAAPPPKKDKQPKKAQANGNGGTSKNAKREQARLEQEIEAAEAALAGLEDELADPTAWGDPRSSAKSQERHAQARRRVEELYSRLEAVS
jgi:ATP-binding cassette subfamily F protein 3